VRREQIVKRARLEARILRSRSRHALAEARRWNQGAARGPETTLLVLGCQRSGTTLVTRLFDADPQAKVYPEHSALTRGDRRDALRLPAPESVAASIARCRFPLVVLKPLVESQNTPTLLESLPGARGLWMFRGWRDVACSNLARFGRDKGVTNLRSVVEQRPTDWRAECVSPAVQRVVAQHFSESMNPHDAAALFWWVRNSFFFELGLDANPALRSCRYEELVMDPAATLDALYHWIGLPRPTSTVLPDISASSIGRGDDVSFSPPIADLCDALFRRLCDAHEKEGTCV
jgi:hypothetical protein